MRACRPFAAIAALAIGLLLPAATAVAASAQQPAPCALPRIGDIRLDHESVFGNVENAHWLFRLGDKLHIDTRPRIIRRELLFRSGETIDLEDLAQTERNLRATNFIAEARVTLVADDGRSFDAVQLSAPGGTLCERLTGIEKVDVIVWTRDSWSTSIEGGLRKADNRFLWSAAFEESNLLGLGKTVRLEHRTDIERDTNSIAYIDPRVAGTRTQLETILADQSDGSRVFVRTGRPFFALDTSFAWTAALDTFEQTDPLWEAGEQVGGLRHLRRHVRFGAAWLLQQRGDTALRVHAGFAHRYDDVEVEIRSHDVLELALTLTEHRFVKLAYLNHERPEDVNLGTDMRVQAGLGAARGNGDSDNALFFDLGLRQGVSLGPRRFLLGTVAWSGRHENGLQNGLLDARVGIAEASWDKQLLLARGWYRHGIELDPEVQLTLGAANGLRGYPVNQFVGDRSLLLGVEYRRFVIDQILRFVSVGFAAFADSGYAWAPGTDMHLSDLRTNAGIGLLFGRRSVSTGRAGLRFDLAYAFDPVPGRSRWVLSFGTATTLGF